MIYFLYGDSAKIFSKANQLIDVLIKKNPEATFLKIDQENFNQYDINELIGGQSLFIKKQIIYLKRLIEDKEAGEEFVKRIKEIKESENIFVIAEEKLNKKEFNKIEKNSEKVQIFEETKEVNKQEKNIFVLTDMLGNRDSKNLWVLYQEFIKYVRPEEIHGILWWQIKSMISVSKSKDVVESGLKPFVYNKNKRFNNNFSDQELEEKADELINMAHESRRSGLGLELALEKFILNI